MKLPLSLVSLSIASALTSVTPAYADHSGVEIIEIMGHQHQVTSSAVNSGSSAPKTDISGLLENLPGAALNSNGPVTGIAQYRGLFGDRINTQANQPTAETLRAQEAHLSE